MVFLIPQYFSEKEKFYCTETTWSMFSITPNESIGNVLDTHNDSYEIATVFVSVFWLFDYSKLRGCH